MERAEAFAVELMTYKRGEEAVGRPFDLGDLEYGDPDQIRGRYNINDSGDIYFMNYLWANRCMWEAFRYRDDSLRESRGYQSKKVVDGITDHHEYNRVKEIVEKHFVIA
jgi:hypothetical protein